MKTEQENMLEIFFEVEDVDLNIKQSLATHSNVIKRIYYLYFEIIYFFNKMVFYTHLLNVTSGKCAKAETVYCIRAVGKKIKVAT